MGRSGLALRHGVTFSGLRQGDGEGEGAPRPLFALEGNRPAHECQDLPADGEPEARASEAATVGGVHLAECLEQHSLHAVGYADAGVRYRKGEVVLSGAGAALGAQAQKHLSLFGEFHRVANQVDEDLPQPQLVAQHQIRDLIAHGACEKEPFAQQFGSKEICRLADAAAQRERLLFDGELARVELRHVEDVV